VFFRQGTLGAREIDAEIEQHPDVEIVRVSSSVQVVESIAGELRRT
jgi:hypothetical protein